MRVEAAGGGLMVQTASGDVSTGRLAAGCLVKTASGDLRVGCLSGGRGRRAGNGHRRYRGWPLPGAPWSRLMP